MVARPGRAGVKLDGGFIVTHVVLSECLLRVRDLGTEGKGFGATRFVARGRVGCRIGSERDDSSGHQSDS